MCPPLCTGWPTTHTPTAPPPTPLPAAACTGALPDMWCCEQDIVIPVMLTPAQGIHLSPLNPMSGTASNRSQTFFFAGRICGNRKPPPLNGTCKPVREDYSANVRQRVRAHRAGVRAAGARRRSNPQGVCLPA